MVKKQEMRCEKCKKDCEELTCIGWLLTDEWLCAECDEKKRKKIGRDKPKELPNG